MSVVRRQDLKLPSYAGCTVRKCRLNWTIRTICENFMHGLFGLLVSLPLKLFWRVKCGRIVFKNLFNKNGFHTKMEGLKCNFDSLGAHLEDCLWTIKVQGSLKSNTQPLKLGAVGVLAVHAQFIKHVTDFVHRLTLCMTDVFPKGLKIMPEWLLWQKDPSYRGRALYLMYVSRYLTLWIFDNCFLSLAFLCARHF